MISRRKWVFWLRLAVLLPFLAGSCLLYHWNRENDPRFYYFLSTRPGQALARFFRWHGAGEAIAGREKPEAAWSEEERRIQQALETELRQAAPSVRMTLHNGKVMTGRILVEEPDALKFEENYGRSGAVAARIARDRIRSLEDLEPPLLSVSRRDVLFKKEFPDLGFFKRAPYTVLTDEKFFQVEHAVRELQKLHRDFLSVFSPVLDGAPKADGIQVLFFAAEEPFRRYQRRCAPRMESSVGFYSPWTDRFTVYNQKNSVQMRAYGEELERQADYYRAQERSYGGAGRIEDWKKSAGQELETLAREQTLETIRHEGAHQLFFTYGAHSRHRIENEWLVEGLAVYCETPLIGQRHAARVPVLKSALAEGGGFIPLAELVAHRSNEGLFSFGEASRIELAYNESWALVHFMMQPERREGFFDYLRNLRDRKQFREMRRADPVALLCRYVAVSPERLEAEWKRYVEGM